MSNYTPFHVTAHLGNRDNVLCFARISQPRLIPPSLAPLGFSESSDLPDGGTLADQAPNQLLPDKWQLKNSKQVRTTLMSMVYGETACTCRHATYNCIFSQPKILQEMSCAVPVLCGCFRLSLAYYIILHFDSHDIRIFLELGIFSQYITFTDIISFNILRV